MSFHHQHCPPLTPSRRPHSLLSRSVDLSSPLKRQWQPSLTDLRAPTPSPLTPQYYHPRTPIKLPIPNTVPAVPAARFESPFQPHLFTSALPIYRRRDNSSPTGTIRGEIPRFCYSSYPSSGSFPVLPPPTPTTISLSPSSTIVLSSPPHSSRIHIPGASPRSIACPQTPTNQRDCSPHHEVRHKLSDIRPYTPHRPGDPSYWVVVMPYPKELEEKILPELRPSMNGGRRRVFPNSIVEVEQSVGIGIATKWEKWEPKSMGMQDCNLGNGNGTTTAATDLKIWPSSDLEFGPADGLPLFWVEQVGENDLEIIWETNVLGVGSEEVFDLDFERGYFWEERIERIEMDLD